ncbi:MULTISPECIES: ATP-binding protein [unclassified Paenibacillus]|uniref:ATP-binding protein n=1 Tax=unclassified Paenibacillus TaxID=185978 RepID=UPI0036297CD0
MIFVTLLFLISSILFTYKKLSNSSTRFLYGIIVGWVLSFISFILYLSKFNYYYNIIHSFFNFSPGTWNYLVLTQFNPNLLIRMLNGGVIIFYSSVLLFAVSFTLNMKPKLQRCMYAAVAILFVVQLLAYDPSLNILWEIQMSSSPILASLDFVLKNLKYAMVILAFGLLLHYYINYPKIKFIKNLTAFHILALIPVVIIHLLLFSWAPKILIKATYLDGYYNYLQPPFDSHPISLYVLPYAFYLALTFIIFIVYKFKSIESYRKNRDIQINKSIDTATLGTRAFTHALKNHLIAIQSETEYVKERHSGDEETAYSLELILKSCRSAMTSIDQAADKLKNIELNLQPLSLDQPVKQALSLINFRERKADIQVKLEEPQSLAYMDLYHMSETLYNLLENAIDSLPLVENGSITIETFHHNGWGLIQITDNGPGVPEDQLDMIFDPFFTTKSSVNNWGIGLSYCHKIVSGHDGKIQVESTLGQGTKFTIFLPLI